MRADLDQFNGKQVRAHCFSDSSCPRDTRGQAARCKSSGPFGRRAILRRRKSERLR